MLPQNSSKKSVALSILLQLVRMEKAGSEEIWLMRMLPAPAARSKLQGRAHPGVRLRDHPSGRRLSIGPRSTRCLNAVRLRLLQSFENCDFPGTAGERGG